MIEAMAQLGGVLCLQPPVSDGTGGAAREPEWSGKQNVVVWGAEVVLRNRDPKNMKVVVSDGFVNKRVGRPGNEHTSSLKEF